MFKLSAAFLAIAFAALPVAAQTMSGSADFKASFEKHLQTSKDFTLKVAEAMPADSYDFKLTKEQMSFGEQMTHLSSALEHYAARLGGPKPEVSKPASKSKDDVIAFVKASFDYTIGETSKLTPEQIAKTYGSGGSAQTGYDLLLGMLNHTTNHRASAEMYLRAKGITPPQYEF